MYSIWFGIINGLVLHTFGLVLHTFNLKLDICLNLTHLLH